ARPGARDRPVRRAGAPRRGIRLVAARSEEALACGSGSCRGRGRGDHRSGRCRRPPLRSRLALARRNRPGRHRRPARRGGRDRRAQADAPAASAARDPRGRKPLQRRERAARVPPRGRRRGCRKLFRLVGAAVARGRVPGQRARRAILSRLLLFIVGRIRDVATSVIIQFVTTFAVWILAERLRLSGIITIVTFAILTARSAPARMPARLRIPSYAVWEVVVFVLNVLAFILVGLQLRPILQRLDRPELFDYLATAAAVCAVVIIVRMLWALAYAFAERWPRRHQAHPRSGPRDSLRSAIAIGWSGMRG